MSDLEIRTFGGLMIAYHGAPVIGLASRKAAALLVYLACTRRPRAREALATLLWDERSQARALANLSVLLTSLRQRLAPFLIITRQTVAFNRDSDYWLDSAALEDRLKHPPQPVSRETAARLETGLALYQGDFLEGFHLRACRDLEEWITVERERLQRLVIEALTELVTFHLWTGDYAAGLAAARRLLPLDPLREEAHRQLMLLLARTGQRSAALAQYQVCRRILAEELGLEPAQETTALYERIQSVRPAHPHNWLAHTPSTPFVGRETELAQIDQRLANPDCRLLTIVGPGGSGKTRLALRVAAHTTAFLHGAYFVPLAPVSSSDFLVPTLAQALDFSFAGQADPAAQLIDYLREKEMLLVLDNFEHLLAGAELLVKLLQQAPLVKLLVTSRERLNLSAEWILDLEGLAYPASREAENIEVYSAARLFIQTARRVWSEFELLPSTRRAVARICQLVVGMPLGIELAAAWVRSSTCEQIVAEIERNLDFLAAEMRDIPERHRSVRAVFEHSWSLLTEDEQRLFARLSVFRGGFRGAAALPVAGAAPPQLAALIDKSMLRPIPSGRYEIHELLRQYAEGKLRAIPAEERATNQNHCAYYAAFVNQSEPGLIGGKQKDVAEALGEDIENIRKSWAWAVEQTDGDAVQKSAKGLFRWYLLRGWFQEGDEVFGRAAAQFGPIAPRFAKIGQSAAATPSGQAEHTLLLHRLLSCQGVFCEYLARYDQAKAQLQASLAQFRTLGAPDDIAFAINRLGILARIVGDYQQAKEHFQASLEIYQELEDSGGMAEALNGLGTVGYFLGEYATASDHFRASLTFRRAIGDQFGLSRCLMNLGNVTYRLGEYEAAKQLHQDSLAICRALDDRWGIAACLNNLGNVVDKLGGRAEAKQLYQESLSLKRHLGHREGIASSLDNLGIVAYELGQFAEARRLRQESLAIRREIGYQWGMANSLNGLGDIACALSELHTARGHYREALQTALEIHADVLVEAALVGIAELVARQGEGEQALRYLALVIDRPARDREIQDRAERLFAELEAKLPAVTVAGIREKATAKTLEAVAAELLGK